MHRPNGIFNEKSPSKCFWQFFVCIHACVHNTHKHRTRCIHHYTIHKKHTHVRDALKCDMTRPGPDAVPREEARHSCTAHTECRAASAATRNRVKVCTHHARTHQAHAFMHACTWHTHTRQSTMRAGCKVLCAQLGWCARISRFMCATRNASAIRPLRHYTCSN